MADQTEVTDRRESVEIFSEKQVAVEVPSVAREQKTRTIKGMLMMVICCAAPLLLLAAIPFLGATLGLLGAAGSGLLSMIALLACPVGMYLMMRMLMKDKKD